MAKKPSEMTNVEAWNESAKAHSILWRAYWNVNDTLPFPPDPVERVSSERIAWYLKHADESVQQMALELIERRKADRDPSVVGQHGEKR